MAEYYLISQLPSLDGLSENVPMPITEERFFELCERFLNKKSQEDAYVCYLGDSLKAFLYLKQENEDENYSNIVPILPPKRRLKIGTFKVAMNGLKLGERFLKIAFDNAVNMNATIALYKLDGNVINWTT